MGDQFEPAHVVPAALLVEGDQQMRGLFRAPGDSIEAGVAIDGQQSAELLVGHADVESINSDYPLAFGKIVEQGTVLVCEAIELRIAVHRFKVHLSRRHRPAGEVGQFGVHPPHWQEGHLNGLAHVVHAKRQHDAFCHGQLGVVGAAVGHILLLYRERVDTWFHVHGDTAVGELGCGDVQADPQTSRGDRYERQVDVDERTVADVRIALMVDEGGDVDGDVVRLRHQHYVQKVLAVVERDVDVQRFEIEPIIIYAQRPDTLQQFVVEATI